MGDVIDETFAILRDCQLDYPAVRDFLDVVISAYRKAEDDDGPPFENFRRLLLTSDDTDTFRAVIEPFLQFAENNGGVEPLRQLEVTGVDTLIRWYGEVLPEEDEGHDDQDWREFLVEYTELSGWTGDEEAWQGYKDYLLYYADERGFSAATTRLLQDAEDAQDKVQFLASNGVTIRAGETADEDDAYDEDAWYAFLAQYGAAWNGDEDSWGQFRDYFLFYADEEGLATPAGAFIEYAEGESDKIGFFAQYGVDVGSADELDDTDLDAWYAFLAEHGTEWDGQDNTWARFRRSFLESAAVLGLTSAASGFLDYAEGEPDRIAFFAQYGITVGPTDSEDVDPDVWNEFLAQYGPAWNGDEANWEQFRTYFLHYAAEWGVESVAIGFIDYADGEADKAAFFAQYGIDVGAGGEVEDADTWNTFLAQYGPAWDGDEANWEQFRTYFLHYAAEWGVESAATGFIDYADGEADKIALFAQYGITIGSTGSVAEDVVEAAKQRAEDAATASPLVADEHVQLISDAFAELVTEMPEAAGLSAAQILQLIEEVAAESREVRQ